jgi:hypothetical protein
MQLRTLQLKRQQKAVEQRKEAKETAKRDKVHRRREEKLEAAVVTWRETSRWCEC